MKTKINNNGTNQYIDSERINVMEYLPMKSAKKKKNEIVLYAMELAGCSLSSLNTI